jgi:hypothetical protein
MIKENAKSRIVTVNSLLTKPENIRAEFDKFVLTRPTDFGTQNNHVQRALHIMREDDDKKQTKSDSNGKKQKKNKI